MYTVNRNCANKRNGAIVTAFPKIFEVRERRSIDDEQKYRKIHSDHLEFQQHQR